MSNFQLWILIGVVAILIVVLVILLFFFVRLYEKVDRLDTSDSHLHLLVGRQETITESIHKKTDQMHRDLTDFGEKMVHVDRLLQLAQLRKQKKASGSDPDDDLILHYVAAKEKK